MFRALLWVLLSWRDVQLHDIHSQFRHNCVSICHHHSCKIKFHFASYVRQALKLLMHLGLPTSYVPIRSRLIRHCGSAQPLIHSHTRDTKCVVILTESAVMTFRLFDLIRGVGHVARIGEMENVYQIFVVKLEGKASRKT